MTTQQPSLADQVTRMYELISGYHATHLIEIARELGVWSAVTARPGITSDELARSLRTDPFYTGVLCDTAYSLGLLEREAAGWRMAPHFDQILGNPDSSFYLADFARVHMLVGEDYADYPVHFRNGSKKPYQEHGDHFMTEVASATKSLPNIFIDAALPQLPALKAQLEGGARLLDVGCGAGWGLVQFAQRFPNLYCTGIDLEPYSVELARRLISENGLNDRCEVRLGSIEQAGQPGTYDVATSFLVIHEIESALKSTVFGGVADALAPGGSFLIFDEAYPETDEDLRTMPKRFAALAQWYELTWGNRVNTRSELHGFCREAGFEVTEETSFSRFHILVATKK